MGKQARDALQAALNQEPTADAAAQQEAASRPIPPIDPPRGDSAKIMVAPLSTRALTEPVKLAREYASAAAAICESSTLQPQSRKNAVKMLKLALELLGE